MKSHGTQLLRQASKICYQVYCALAKECRATNIFILRALKRRSYSLGRKKSSSNFEDPLLFLFWREAMGVRDLSTYK